MVQNLEISSYCSDNRDKGTTELALLNQLTKSFFQLLIIFVIFIIHLKFILSLLFDFLTAVKILRNGGAYVDHPI